MTRDGRLGLEQLIEHGWTSVENRGCQPKGRQNLCVVNFRNARHFAPDRARRNISSANTYLKKLKVAGLFNPSRLHWTGARSPKRIRALLVGSTSRENFANRSFSSGSKARASASRSKH